MKLSEYEDIETVRALIIGLPGSGKSTLAAEMAEHGWNLIWLNVENAAKTLRKLSPEAQARITLVNIPDTATFPVACQTLIQLFQKNKADICDVHGVVGCSVCKKAEKSFTLVDLTALTNKDIVVLDTGTQLGQSILAYATKDLPITAKAERDDWGKVRKYTEFFKSQFQGAQFNLIVTCHCQEAELEDGKTRLVPQFGSSSMGANFGSAFDHVIYCDLVNKEHKAFSSSTASTKFLTRSRDDFAIEREGALSLLPIFTGDRKPKVASTNVKKETSEGGASAGTSIKTKDTPGDKALTGLAKLRAEGKL